MKRWVMFSLVILASLITGVGYYYYNYIYVSPKTLAERTIGTDNLAYNELVESVKTRLDTGSYEYKVLINPVCGGDNKGQTSGTLTESNTVLTVAQYVKLLNTDETLGIFLTRESDTDPDADKRESIYDMVSPDMVIDLHLSSDTDNSVMGTTVYYDDGYYDYHMTNSMLSDIMEKAVVTQIEGVAGGIAPSDDESYAFIYDRKIPSAAICCGYISNAKEAEAMASDAYLSNIAQGILDGIAEVRSNVN